MTEDHFYFDTIFMDPRYRTDPEFQEFPLAESVSDCAKRMIPYWQKVIVPQMKEGKSVIISSHKLTITGLMYYLSGV